MFILHLRSLNFKGVSIPKFSENIPINFIRLKSDFFPRPIAIKCLPLTDFELRFVTPKGLFTWRWEALDR